LTNRKRGRSVTANGLKGEGPVTAVQRTIEETEGAFDVFCGLAGKELPISLRAGCVRCVPAPDCVDLPVRLYEAMRLKTSPFAEGRLAVR
jgi:hypothetical protein